MKKRTRNFAAGSLVALIPFAGAPRLACGGDEPAPPPAPTCRAEVHISGTNWIASGYCTASTMPACKEYRVEAMVTSKVDGSTSPLNGPYTDGGRSSIVYLPVGNGTYRVTLRDDGIGLRNKINCA